MLSDMLELAGWQVRYLGANTPEKDLMEMVRSFQPHLLALSVTMPFHLDRALALVAQVRADTALDGVRIMVGGLGTVHSGELLLRHGVDGTAADAGQAVALADSWVRA
jgi:methanogenic corrinoid protein MtbC1